MGERFDGIGLGGEAVGEVGDLGREDGSEFGGFGAVWFDEGEVFAGGVEAEVGVELAAGGAAVFVGGPDDEVVAGVEGDGGEGPAGGEGGVVGEGPAFEIDWGGGGIVDFDPVAEIAVLVGSDRVVVGHEFGDDGLGGGGGGEGEGGGGAGEGKQVGAQFHGQAKDNGVKGKP